MNDKNSPTFFGSVAVHSVWVLGLSVQGYDQ